MREYTKARSKFWLKIFENDDCTTISANDMVKRLVENIAPNLTNLSPTGWRESQNYVGVYFLWIPDDQRDDYFRSELEILETWAERANRHIWLGTNRNTRDMFSGDEVDFCLAGDWNMEPDTRERTEIGEAEYQMKYNYPRGRVDQQDAEEYANILFSAILDCVDCLPHLSDYIVAAIPATKENQNKLAWQMAAHIAKQLDAPFLGVTLLKDKPQMKEESVENKIRIWRSIYDGKNMPMLSRRVEGKTILIIDDLYQSGASIWCFAEFLKEVCGAREVIAITSVKALKDGDNQ